MNWDLDYGSLPTTDPTLVSNCEELKKSLMEVQQVLDQVLPLRKQYDKLSLPAKIELDLFIVYTMNSLYWIKLRLDGVDTTNHRIKDEFVRIKAAMEKWQQVKDRNKRPTVDKEAAKRFIRSGLYDPNGTKPNKKIKFVDNDD